MKAIGSVLLLSGLAWAAFAGDPPPWTATPARTSVQQLFPPGSVRLLEGYFKTMQDADHAYLIRLEPDRLLAQFRVEAGLEPKAKPYGGWESPAQPGKTWSLAGHSLGHYLSAASLMYRMTDDERLKDRVSYIARELRECQERRGDGSLVAFPYARELEADIRAGKVETVDRYWAPFYTIHKQLAGLRDAWLWCGDATARQVLRDLADWCGGLVKDLSDERRERLLNMEHGGMAEVLADVYAITGESKYLDYARLFSHRALLEPLAAGNDTLNGKHANTQVPKFTGFQRIHELGGDDSYGKAARFFWETVVANRTWVNGGNSIHEHFPDPMEMGKLLINDGGPETCNTYNMLRLTEELYRESPAMAYVDYYENALFDHILSSQAPLPGAGAFVYYTPLRPDFARSYGTDFHSFWCCTGTGMENHARYGQFIFAHDGKALTVNLFVASSLEWAGRGVALRQETRFPDEPRTRLVFTAAPAEEFTLRIRHPAWLASERLRIRLNGQPVTASSQRGGYADITRVWKPGDQVVVGLPMKPRAVRQPQTPGWVSFFYGPILLAGELGPDGLARRDFFGPYTPAKGIRPLAKAPVVVVEDDEQMISRLSAIPGRPATFRTDGLIKPSDLTLAPFYRTHFQRYALYWQVTSADAWEENQRQVAEAERRERALDERTIDRVRIGEQQPEIDHNLRFEKSQSGSGPEGRRWRHAPDGGWFSYDLKLPAPEVKASLYVVYWGLDQGREFDLLVDGTPLTTVSLRGGKSEYYGVEYELPSSLVAGKETITVRFQAKPGQTAGGIFDLRVVKGEAR